MLLFNPAKAEFEEAPDYQRLPETPLAFDSPLMLECLKCGAKKQSDHFSFVCESCQSSNFMIIHPAGAKPTPKETSHAPSRAG